MAKPILRVKTIHINSAILAAKSPFFFKLFSSGMKGSERQTALRIADSEEITFMELLRFMYSGKLSPTTEATLVVDVMMASEKFEVVSCMRLCRQRLRNLPVIPESSMTSLDLPCSNSVAAELTEAAKIFLAKRYEDFLSREFEGELMRIPLAGIEAILSKNDLGLVSEEAVYDFVHWWARSRYPNPKERRKILRSRLVPLVPIIFY